MWNLVDVYDTPSLTADGRTVHAVGEGRGLTAYDAATGEVRWRLAQPPEGSWAREESYEDGVVALVSDASGASRTVCRVGGDGQVRWCTPLDRAAADLRVGAQGTGLWVETDTRDGLVLDPDTGRTLTTWRPGGELHLYWDLGEPHDTEWVSSVAVLGVFGGVSVVVGGDGTLTGLGPDGVVWTRPVGGRFGMGAFGGALGFAHGVAPGVVGAGSVFQLGDTLVGLTPSGALAWTRSGPAGRLVDTPSGPVLVTATDVRGVDAVTGADRWRTELDGFGAVVGERGPVAWLEPAAPSRDLVWVDPHTGLAVARTPLAGLSSTVEATAGGVLGIAVDGDDHRWSMRGLDGVERWSFHGSLGRSAGEGFAYTTRERIDLETGRVLGPGYGHPVAEASGVRLVYVGPGYAVVP
jgi:hypothetical protein